ncbi:hypothetical protein GpSGHVEth012 [Glossina pallidipes salivary gland hypertrophy virus]|uniref:Uncharacterized protein n=1 Tax=Glossina hytrovirus (isolate Glossina pallidipes/Ethiopia/Seibersdorf/-) TaxID=379529 RepID=A0A0Y0KFL6_GHVS|nr:hypothetical protein GpSGHVEth012 [Glossina pallidipes salivary gland hypertrophy virus]
MSVVVSYVRRCCYLYMSLCPSLLLFIYVSYVRRMIAGNFFYKLYMSVVVSYVRRCYDSWEFFLQDIYNL